MTSQIIRYDHRPSQLHVAIFTSSPEAEPRPQCAEAKQDEEDTDELSIRQKDPERAQDDEESAEQHGWRCPVPVVLFQEKAPSNAIALAVWVK